MAWPNNYESGVTLYDKNKAFYGYTLITTITRQAASEPFETPDEVRLMDMTGKSVHTWKTPYPEKLFGRANRMKDPMSAEPTSLTSSAAPIGSPTGTPWSARDAMGLCSSSPAITKWCGIGSGANPSRMDRSGGEYSGLIDIRRATVPSFKNVDGRKIPVFMAVAELDMPSIHYQNHALINALYKRDKALPIFKVLIGHNHISAPMHYNTKDDVLGPEILEFIKVN